MADPTLFAASVAVERNETLAMLAGLLEKNVEGSGVPYAERYDNPYLLGSPEELLAAVKVDPGVQEAHSADVMVATLTRVVAAQQETIEELQAEVAELRRIVHTGGSEATTPKKRARPA